MDGWGRAEIAELQHVLLTDEVISECVNGIYEGGFALLVATDIRVLLVDKKPLNYLTVEDVRFDMISEMDYNHRMFGANIRISAGSKSLIFRSYNKIRLRKLIGHVQHCMAEVKKKQNTHQEGQVNHLQQINRQLQAYLIAQNEYQLQLQQMAFDKSSQNYKSDTAIPSPPKPSNELADYLYAQSLLARYAQDNNVKDEPIDGSVIQEKIINDPALPNLVEQKVVKDTKPATNKTDMGEIYEEGVKEIFGDTGRLSLPANTTESSMSYEDTKANSSKNLHIPFDISPLHIAYSKLPLLLRNRKFSRAALRSTVKSSVNPSPSGA
jgi:hypothetical protein